MYTKMDSDYNRFKKIVKGWLRKELKNFIVSGDITTRLPTHKSGLGGSKTITVPLPRIELPQFEYGSPTEQNGGSGVGQGGGEVGEAVPATPADEGQQAGEISSQHGYEDEVSLDTLAQMLGEELALPRIENKREGALQQKRRRFSGVVNQGPESLHHFRCTYRAALKRSLAAGEYDLHNPVIVPIKDDRRYRSHDTVAAPQGSAAIIYMMDVSGSMGEMQKELVRLTSFWLDTWIMHAYQGVERRFIVHDATAQVVAEDVFYRIRESGGTLISSAYKQAAALIAQEFNPQDWNVYLFHFSDGDNWSQSDTQICLQLLEDELLPAVNLFGYGQTESRYGSGQFLKDLQQRFDPKSVEKVITSQIAERAQIVDTLKTFLGKGR